MKDHNSKSSDKSSAKESRRKIVRYLVDDLGFTFSDIRQIWRVKKHVPFFHFKTVLLDFRGCK